MLRPSKLLHNVRHFCAANKHIVISDPVKSALKNGEPVVALESTIITHGMPFPHNLQTSQKVESIIKKEVRFM